MATNEIARRHAMAGRAGLNSIPGSGWIGLAGVDFLINSPDLAGDLP
jgi:hypothetical protein